MKISLNRSYELYYSQAHLALPLTNCVKLTHQRMELTYTIYSWEDWFIATKHFQNLHFNGPQAHNLTL